MTSDLPRGRSVFTTQQETDMKAGDKCIVHGRWPGLIKGSATSGKTPGYVVQYAKHGSNIVQIVPASAVKPAKK